jgi:hypothetical protein
MARRAAAEAGMADRQQQDQAQWAESDGQEWGRGTAAGARVAKGQSVDVSGLGM